MTIIFPKLQLAYEGTKKEYPDLTFNKARLYIVRIKTQTGVDAVHNIYRNFGQRLIAVANNYGIKSDEYPAFEAVVVRYYKPAKNNVFKPDFQKGRLRPHCEL